jgi:O-antigen ligase
MPRFLARDVPAKQAIHDGGPAALLSHARKATSVSAIARMQPAIASPSEPDRIGLLVTLMGIYLFMHVMPFAEVSAVHFHLHVPIVAFMCAMLTLMSPFTLRLQRFFESSIAVPWMLMAILFFLASAFGFYPRMSISFITGYLGRFHIMPVLICAIVVTTRQVRHIIFWIIGAHVAALLLCAKYGQLADGRLFIPGYDYQNPNDLALCLIFGACFVLFMFFPRSPIGKLVGLAILAVTIVFVARTGSRGGFVCLIILAVALFITSSRSVRLLVVATAPLAMVLLIVVLPHGTWLRLSKITLNPQDEYFNTGDEELRRAVESQMARMNLQHRAVELAVRHPLLGVGPLMFADASDSLVRAQTGKKSSWQNPHNVYLQIAAETGIPALILFITCMVLCLRLNYRSVEVCRGAAEHKAAYGQSLCLLLATLTFAIGILFSNFAYASYMPILIGVTAANALAVKKEIQTTQDENSVAPSPQGALAKR